MKPKSKAKSPTSYPLGALFLLLTIVAVLIVPLKELAKKEIWMEVQTSVPQSAVIGLIAGLACGVIIGLYHFRRQRGAMIGMVAGATTGALAGPVCALSFVVPWPVIFSSLTGGLALLVVASVFRVVNSNDTMGQRNAFETMGGSGHASSGDDE